MYNVNYVYQCLLSSELSMIILRQCSIRTKTTKSYITCESFHTIVNLELEKRKLGASINKISTHIENINQYESRRLKTIHSVKKYSTDRKPPRNFKTIFRNIKRQPNIDTMLFGKLIKRRNTEASLKDENRNHELLWFQRYLKKIDVIRKGKHKIQRKSYSDSTQENISLKRDVSNTENEMASSIDKKTVDTQNNIQQETETSINNSNSETTPLVSNDQEPSMRTYNSQFLPSVPLTDIESFSIFQSEQTDSITENNEASLNEQEMDGQKHIKYPSVSTILRDTMTPESQRVLEMWKQRMIKMLGKEGFKLYQKELMRDGSILHSCIQKTLLHEELEIPKRIEPAYSSLKDVLSEVQDVLAIEARTSHRKLRYRGIVDSVLSYRGKQCVVDWKKSDKIKTTIGSTYDAPVQVAAYIGAINASGIYSNKIDTGLIVVAHTNGYPAIVHEITGDVLQMYWKTWLGKLRQYYSQGIYRTF